jgi:hypothetical protein
MKQTAVDWFFDNLKNHEVQAEHLALYEKAKKMEKKQMLNAFEESRLTHPMIGFKHETFKDYYSETFNTNEK